MATSLLISTAHLSELSQWKSVNKLAQRDTWTKTHRDVLKHEERINTKTDTLKSVLFAAEGVLSSLPPPRSATRYPAWESTFEL